MAAKQPEQFRILKPLTPGVFDTGTTQRAITTACEEQGVNVLNVCQVGMLGNEVLTIDVRYTFAPMSEPEPEDPECGDIQTVTRENVTTVLAHNAEVEKCQAQFQPVFDRWAEIQRYRHELARIDAERPVTKYRKVSR